MVRESSKYFLIKINLNIFLKLHTYAINCFVLLLGAVALSLSCLSASTFHLSTCMKVFHKPANTVRNLSFYSSQL